MSESIHVLRKIQRGIESIIALGGEFLSLVRQGKQLLLIMTYWVIDPDHLHVPLIDAEDISSAFENIAGPSSTEFCIIQ